MSYAKVTGTKTSASPHSEHFQSKKNSVANVVVRGFKTKSLHFSKLSSDVLKALKVALAKKLQVTDLNVQSTTPKVLDIKRDCYDGSVESKDFLNQSFLHCSRRM